MSDLAKAIENRKQQGNFRELRICSHRVDFCSNDYLGLARSPLLCEKIKSRFLQIDCLGGSTGSRLVSGNSPFAESLERRLAEFHQAEAGLLFNSGYDANLGLLACVAQRTDTIIYDGLVHASMRDGIRLSHAKSYSFRHNDLGDLRKKVQLARGNIFIAVEALYSMDGDFAPLEELSELAREVGAHLVVDEAHSNGICGALGRGRVVELGLQKSTFARIHTFGKAIGCHGAIVVGSLELKNYLINFARPFIYSTALPAHSLLTIDCAYDFLEYVYHETGTDGLTAHQCLLRNISTFNDYCSAHKDILRQQGPIQIVSLRNNEAAKSMAFKAQEKGFDVRAILSPTVPQGTERLRICLHAFNSEQEIVNLCRIICA